MATKQIGPIQFQGKLDSLVGRSTRKGYMSLGMKAKKITNPNTPKQVRARTEFACAQAYGNGIPAAALAGLRPYSRGIKASIRNAAAKLCYDLNVIETIPSQKEGFQSQIRPETFFYSKGNMPNVFATKTDISTDEPNTVKVGWNKGAIESTLVLCHVILYHQDSKTFLHQIVAANEQTASFQVPQYWTGGKVFLYIYTQYPPQDPDGVKYFSEFATATSEEREAIETRSLYSPTLYVGDGVIG